jgi:hypothetical protein
VTTSALAGELASGWIAHRRPRRALPLHGGQPSTVSLLHAPPYRSAIRKKMFMRNTLRLLSISVLAVYAAYVVTLVLSSLNAAAQSQGAPPDKTVSATPPSFVIASALVLLLSLLILGLGILEAVASSQRQQAGWRNSYILLTVLGTPGPILGVGLAVGGLFSGGMLGVLFLLVGIVLVLLPIAMSVTTLVHERRPIALRPTPYAPVA